MSVFYDPLLELDELDRQLHDLALDYHEKEQLLEIVDSALHHAVLDTILSELPSHKHQEFLQNFAISPHDPAHLEYLIVHSPDIESKIRAQAKRTKEKFKEEIRKVKTAQAKKKTSKK